MTLIRNLREHAHAIRVNGGDQFAADLMDRAAKELE